MRHGQPGRRLRNRGHNNSNGRRNGGNGANRNQVFDSNGPDVRIRGTAHQILEKYAALAKDAASGGDRILAESYLQHAEHYQRIISSWAEQMTSREFYQPQYNDDDGQEGDAPSDDRRFDVRQVRPIQQQRPDLGLPPSITGEVQNVRQVELTEA